MIAAEPTDEDLVRFANSLLHGLDAHLREPEILMETIQEHRELWVMLFRVANDIDDAH